MARFASVSVLVALLLSLVAAPANAASQRYVIPGDTVFPEGIATNPDTGDFYVGSSTSGNIYRGNVDSPTVELFLPGGTDGRTDVRGLKVSANGRLYLAGGTTAQLFVYDVASKRLLAKFATGLTPSFVNDVAIAPNGDAYFTDSNSPAIYRVAADVTAANAFERWIDLTGSPIVYGQGFNLNGIAVSPDGKYLVTVQSNTGKLFRIEIASKRVTEIATGGESLAAGDGVLIVGQQVLVMRNAAATLVTLRMGSDFGSGTVISRDTDADFTFPTTFGRVGGSLLVVNSQLDKRTANQPPVLPFTIVRVAVPGAVVLPPATGNGGNMPGLPNTGSGGMADGGAPWLVVAVGLAALIGLGGGLAYSRRRAG